MLAFIVLHGEGLLCACCVDGVDNLVVSAELAHGSRVEQAHVLEGAAANEHAGFACCGASLRLNGVDLDTELAVAVKIFKLLFSFGLGLGEGEIWDDGIDFNLLVLVRLAHWLFFNHRPEVKVLSRGVLIGVRHVSETCG